MSDDHVRDCLRLVSGDWPEVDVFIQRVRVLLVAQGAFNLTEQWREEAEAVKSVLP